MLKKIQIAAFILLLIATSTAVAQESIIHTKVDAYDRNLSLSIDGKEQALSVKPLIIDGKVMVAARDVAKILGKPVVWSKQYNLVNFSSQAKVLDFPTDLTTQVVKKPTAAVKIPYRYIEKMKVLRNVGPFYQLAKRKIAIAGTRYDQGVVVDLVPPPGQSAKAEVKIFLNGNYTGLNGYVGVEDGTMNSSNGFILRVYNDGVLSYESGLIEPGDLAFRISKDMVGDLSNVSILKIEVETQGIESGVGDPKVKAALANFKLYRK